MKFNELLVCLGERLSEEDIYSIEVRNMLTHETEMDYLLSQTEALAKAEESWKALTKPARADWEISVHLGHLEQKSSGNVRFVVHQKLFRAYKKVLVAESFAHRFLKERTAFHQIENDLSQEEAASLARKEFGEIYELQPKTAYGMFAGFTYEPKEIMAFA